MKTYRLKVIIIALIVTVVGLLCFMIAQLFGPNSKWSEFFYVLFHTLLIGGLSTVLYEFYLRDEIIKMNDLSADRVIKHWQMANGVSELGLDEISRDTNAYDFSNFLLKSNEIFILLNDGRTWTSRHEADIADRLAKRGFKTHFVLVHPDSLFVPILAKKTGTSPEQLKEKINETIGKLGSHLKDGHDLSVYGHFLPTCSTLFMDNDRGFLSPYPTARKADRLPMYVYANRGEGCYYQTLRRDLLEVINSAERMFPKSILSPPPRSLSAAVS